VLKKVLIRRKSMRKGFTGKRVIVILAIYTLVVSAALSGCGSGEEDAKTAGSGDTAAQVLKGGVVYTVAGDDWDKAPAEAVAISADGKILAVGTDDEIDAYAGDDTEVTDLGGKTVMPGFIDTHVHFPGTALTELFNIDLYGEFTKDDTLAAIKAFIDENPDLDAYFGSGFSMGISDSSNGPKKEWLDEINADKPIILTSNDGHSRWLNSKALEAMDITTDTKLENGSIPIDPDTGELWGVVTDGSSIVTMTPEYNEEQEMEGLKQFQSNMLGWGFTAAMDISSNRGKPEYLKQLEDSGELFMRINLAGAAQPTSHVAEVISETKAMKESFADSKLLTVSAIKFFADGVVEGVTAYLKEPYAPGAEREADYRSHLNYKTDFLKEFYKEAMAEGFQVHTHSIGDAATSDVLDALEYAQSENPDVDARNVITHLQLVDDVDKERMASLNVIASTQPFWHIKEPDWYDEIDAKNLGDDRAWTEYPVKSFADKGVRVTFSSDHPVSPIDNPFWAVEAAVTRNLYNAEYYGVDDITDIDDPKWLLNPDERITAKEAVEAYTINGAYQLGRENEIGSIEAGKYADMIVLDQDVINVDPLKIDGTQVMANIIGGKVVSGSLG
jgi:predicted amidohydrolase YtcJ